MSWRKLLWAEIPDRLTEEEFWEVVDGSSAIEVFYKLMKLEPATIKEFERTFLQLKKKLERVLKPAWLDYNGYVEDAFIDAMYTIIGKGKDMFLNALNHPEAHVQERDYSGVDIGYVFTRAWEEKTGEEFQWDWKD